MLTQMKGSHRPGFAETLDTEFVHGKVPTPDQLFGGPDVHLASWRVIMLTGFPPNMGGSPLFHRKEFQRTTDGTIVGCNIFRADWRWGWFKLDLEAGKVNADVVDGPPANGSMLIDYDVPENGWLLRGNIVDYVRTTLDPDVLIGRFYYRLWSDFRFGGFFHAVRLIPHAQVSTVGSSPTPRIRPSRVVVKPPRTRASKVAADKSSGCYLCGAPDTALSICCRKPVCASHRFGTGSIQDGFTCSKHPFYPLVD